jgi:hypothetical protein
MRILFLAVIALLATAAPAAADPVKSDSVIFEVTCPGTATFSVVGTGAAGHVLGSTSIAVLLTSTQTVFVNGVQVDQVTVTHPGGGTPTLEGCTAIAEFVDPNGDTVRIEITDAAIVLTPPRP